MRTFFGVVFALLALFCGGCSLAVIGSMGLQTSEDFMMVFMIGGIPMILSGLLAWALLRGRPAARKVTDPWQTKTKPQPSDPDHQDRSPR